MNREPSLREWSNPAPYIEQALADKSGLVDMVAAGDMFTGMDPEGYVATSDACDTIAHTIAEIVDPAQTDLDGNKQAVLAALDGVWKIANHSRIVGIARFSLAEDGIQIPSGKQEIEHLMNTALSYMHGHSDIAVDLLIAARPHLDPENKHAMANYVGFALGLMLANNGEAEKAAEDRIAVAKVSQAVARAATATHVHYSQNGYIF
jgi:hypothetical protein